MMPEIDLLKRYPKATRDLGQRAKVLNPENVLIARQYGKEYFDGSRDTGYGGYKYDGRWQAVACDMVNHFGLFAGDRFLDVGCAKGFLVHEMVQLHMDAYGLDISEYAIMNCDPHVIGRLHLGNCLKLPFPDHSFAAVVSINAIHDFERAECIEAVREIERVSRGRAYIQVDSYRTPEEQALFANWALTARTHGYPDDWEALFAEAGYTGDFGFTIIH